ncbi:hypothetical protein M153_3630006380 [Pseudoloma neurophilia]|uniref:Uncharacterized protein n=1 Tax=Pseudoloma neurophilia TaxID=146866 RepID=A0A0R0LXV5_9MICR|nr:hypothetical protein M153_3630006380 [Pseudoloma neurophilia]
MFFCLFLFKELWQNFPCKWKHRLKMIKQIFNVIKLIFIILLFIFVIIRLVCQF